jgi:hypothetical protein|tara:strand:- start:6239 stop:6373 length:135 start_codon:yes stop_codon:yes gene_type:complete
MNQYVVADRLHTTIDTIKEMSLDEFNHWIAYLTLENKRMKKDGR